VRGSLQHAIVKSYPGHHTRDQGKTKNLDAATRDFAKRVRLEFAPDLARSPAVFRREAVRLFRAFLSPGPGRPRLSYITLATEEQGKGTSWKVIYPMCIPQYAALCRDSQRVEADMR